jgi:hypothetical protein
MNRHASHQGRVGLQPRILGKQRRRLVDRLRDPQSFEWIAMQQRQLGDGKYAASMALARRLTEPVPPALVAISYAGRDRWRG